MADKWYSNGLTAEEAEKLHKSYAKIKKPIYGITDRDVLALSFVLHFEDSTGTDFQLTSQEDIKELLIRTKSFEISRLDGRIVEAFRDGNGGLSSLLKGLSVNENLI